MVKPSPLVYLLVLCWKIWTDALWYLAGNTKLIYNLMLAKY